MADSLPLSEIGWAWSKVLSEPSPDKLLDTLIQAWCAGAFGDPETTVFSLRDGEWRWSRQAAISIVQSADFRGSPVYRMAYLEDWHLRRSDFAAWYAKSHLSAGASLERLWPDPKAQDLVGPDAVPAEREPSPAVEKSPPHSGPAGSLVSDDLLRRLAARKRGRKPRKRTLAAEAMRRIDRKRLNDMLEKEMVEEFGHIAQRTTLREARKFVLSERALEHDNGRQIAGNDK